MTQRPLDYDPVPMARATDPQTSFDAARSVRNLGALHKAILKILTSRGPMTDPVLEEYYQSYRWYPTNNWPEVSPSGLRTRRSELVKARYVRDSGQRAKLSTGRMAIQWEVVP